MPGSLSDNPDINKSSLTPIATHFKAVLPRPGQDSVLYFDKVNITDFLRHWDIACEDCDISDEKKCAWIIDYCSPEVQEIIEVLEGYTGSNWEKLQTELKGLFWQYDKQRDSTISLNQLIKDTPNLDLNIFIIHYSAISEKLVESGALSSLDHTIRLINSLPDKLREQTIDLCTKENWKLSANDIGIEIPKFDKIKEFILSKAHSAQKRAVLDQERGIAKPFVSISAHSERLSESSESHPSTPNIISNSAPTSSDSSPKDSEIKDSMEDVIQ